MKYRKIANRSIPCVGLGCMGMSEFYGDTDDATSLDTLAQAFEIGYRNFDTADMYGYGHNEQLLKKFIQSYPEWREEIFLSSKAGLIRDKDEKYNINVNGRPEYIKQACEASLQRTGTEYIDLYYLHRTDPNVPIEETVGAMHELLSEGKIRAIGLSEVSSDQLRRANQIHKISAVQNELSLWSRDNENEILTTCEELDVAFVAFSPLGRGFLSGQINKQFLQSTTEAKDFRKRIPRFSNANIDNNLAVLDNLTSISERLELSFSEIALSWVLAKSDNIHIIPGSKTPKHLAINFNSQNIHLSNNDITEIEKLFSTQNIMGTRYPQTILEKSN